MRGIPVNTDLLLQLRRSRAWTQETLAAAAGCTVRTIQSAERSTPVDAGTLRPIATALEVDAAKLSAFARSVFALPRHSHT